MAAARRNDESRVRQLDEALRSRPPARRRGTPEPRAAAPARRRTLRSRDDRCHRPRVPLLRPPPDLRVQRSRGDALPADHHRGRVDRRGGGTHVPHRRARGDPPAHRGGDARHQPLPPPGSPRAAAQDHRRPRGVRQRPLRRARPAQERQHLRRRRAAHVPGHRHRDRDGQEVRGRADRRRRRRGDQPRRVRRLHPAQPALLPARAADDVRGEEHRHQPAGPDRALLHARQGRPGVQVPLHGQGRRLGQQVVPLPGDQGRPQPDAADGVPRREDPLARHRRVPAVPPRRRHRRHERGVRAEDREVRLRALPRRPADRGLDERARHPRRRAGGEGLRAHPVLRDRRAVRRQVLLPRRPRRPAAAPRRVLPGRDRGLLLRRPPGARQDHARGRVPRAARDRPRPLHARRRGLRRDLRVARSCRSTSTSRWPTSSPSCRSTR